jgi:hypothetical protein
VTPDRGVEPRTQVLVLDPGDVAIRGVGGGYAAGGDDPEEGVDTVKAIRNTKKVMAQSSPLNPVHVTEKDLL